MEKNLKRLGRFPVQEREKYHSNTLNESFLAILFLSVKTEGFVELRYARGHSPVVERSAGVRELPSSSPVVPYVLMGRKCSKAQTWAIVEECKINFVTESRSWSPSNKFACVEGPCTVEPDN